MENLSGKINHQEYIWDL